MAIEHDSANTARPTRAREAADSLPRLVVAIIIGAHGVVRASHGGVAPFGEWLDTQGLPFGLAIAAAVTALEIVAAFALVADRGLRWLIPPLVGVYTTGIVLVHAPAGWFVVGPGRNGAEFSVLLIACLAGLWLRRGGARAPR